MIASLDRLNGPARAIAASFILAHTRSHSEPTLLTLTRAPGVIALKILPETAGEGGDYRVTLEPTSGDATSHLAADIRVRPDPDGFVRVYLDPTLLRPGDYGVSLIQGSHTEGFPIRVVFLP